MMPNSSAGHPTYSNNNSINNSANSLPSTNPNPSTANAGTANAKDEPRERQRVTKACDNCRKKKIKCDAKADVCTSCEQLQIACLYLDPTKKRGPPKGSGHRLHRVDPSASANGSSDDHHNNHHHNNNDSTSGPDLLNSRAAAAMALAEQQQRMKARPISRPLSHNPLKPQYLQQLHMLQQMDQAHSRDTDLQRGGGDYRSVSPALGSETSAGDYQGSSPSSDSVQPPTSPQALTIDQFEMTDDMGHLSLDPAGHERYVGKSSPMFYAAKHLGGYILPHVRPESVKFIENPDLPSPEVITRLLNLHFKYVHPFAPVFVWSKFLKRLHDHDYTPSFLLLLNSVFALAARFSDDPTLRKHPAKPETAGHQWADRAKAILDTIYDTSDLNSVAGLVLLSMQQMGTGNGWRAWMYVGLAVRMAQHLGLNRDCLKLNPNMPRIGREERNRVWWSCFMIDRFLAAAFGRPQGINEYDCDATNPEGYDEDTSHLSHQLPNATSVITGPAPNSEQNFVHFAALMRIMGRVMVSLYSPLSRASSLSQSAMTNPAPLEQLDKELTDWLLTLPPHLQFRTVQPEPGTFISTLHMVFYSVLILLHKPYSHQSPHMPAGDSSISLSICTSAANNIIEICSILIRTAVPSDHDSTKPNNLMKCMFNYAVFILFTAGTVHVTNCTSQDPILAEAAKLRTADTLRGLFILGEVWITGLWCSETLSNLIQARRIDLPRASDGTIPGYIPSSDLINSSNIIGGISPGGTSIKPAKRYTGPRYHSTKPASEDSTKSPPPAEPPMKDAFVPLIEPAQNFAFDLDQIMGYYQPAAGGPDRHAKGTTGRNMRFFSPTPYYNPTDAATSGLSRSLSQSNVRRGRLSKQVSPTPVTPGGSNTIMQQQQQQQRQQQDGLFSDPTTPGLDTAFFGSVSMDPFGAGDSGPMDMEGMDLGAGGNDMVQDPLATSGSQVTGGLQMYHNPFSATLWGVPTSMDSDEWSMFMQNGRNQVGEPQGSSSTIDSNGLFHTLATDMGGNRDNSNNNNDNNNDGRSTSTTIDSEMTPQSPDNINTINNTNSLNMPSSQQQQQHHISVPNRGY